MCQNLEIRNRNLDGCYKIVTDQFVNQIRYDNDGKDADVSYGLIHGLHLGARINISAMVSE